MLFKSLIVSPIIRQDQDYTRRELWHLKQEIKKVFLEYGAASCTYYSRSPESTLHGYQENFAIVDFKTKDKAKNALKVIDQGWICVNKMQVTAKHIELNNSPIQKLPNECLLEIFKYLLVYDQLKLQKICRRWKKVTQPLWKNVTKIDLRQKDRHLRDPNYIINSGVHLRDIYCYEDHGLKIIGKYCPNVENVAIEFRRYTKRREIDRARIKFEINILPRFRHLTRLMLMIRNDQYTYFEFLRHLPETMIEIHLLNDIRVKDHRQYYWDAPRVGIDYQNYGRKIFNLSRFTKLRALTLKAYIFDENSIVGLEYLKKLTCLRLDDCMLSQACIHRLKFFTGLVHLSLKHVELDYNDAWEILMRNKELEYLALPLLNDCKYEELWARALELPKLKTLCWSHVTYKIRETGRSELLENMELDYVALSERRFLLLFDTFPNLKKVKWTSWRTSDRFVTRVRNRVLERPTKIPFKFISGKIDREWYLPAPIHSGEEFHHCEEPSPEDAKLFRCDMWNEWYVDDNESLQSISIKDYHSLFSTDNSYRNININQLSDDNLAVIFSYLRIDDKSSCSDVCKRWEKIVNENSASFTNFDVRQLSDHSKKTQCLLKYGKYFEDVYSYKSCGFLALKKYCPNIKNLAVDFGVKRCDCKTSSNEFYGVKSLGMMLKSFKHLTKLMIKDVTAFCSDIFEYLPESLEELHIFNRNPGKMMTGKKEVPIIERRNISINLSRLKNLKALTLVQANLPVDELFDETVGVIGLEIMKNLLHLRLSGDISIVNPDSLIRDPLPLEYLSLTQSTITISNLPFLLKYENIQYLDMTDSFADMKSHDLPAILLFLRRLKILRMSRTSSEICEDDELWEFSDIPDLMHLEILDCLGYTEKFNNLISHVVVGSPNLKMVNMTVILGNYLEDLLAIAESARINNKEMLNIFVGMRGLQIANSLGLSAAGVQLKDNPSFEYYGFLRRLCWQGWSVEDEVVNIDGICGKLQNTEFVDS